MVLVTGGTGFVGRSIVRRLLSRGERVRALYRSERRRFIQDEKIEWIPGEIGSRESLLRGAKGADAVIHLVGILIEPGGETFEQLHVEGTRNVVEAMKQAGVRRLLHMSALGSGPNAASRYHRTKWQAEELVRAASLDATIFRPSLIFGQEDRSINLLAKIASYSPAVPVVGPGENRFQPVWVEDVAEAFVQSLQNPIAFGKRYDLCGPRVYSFNDLIDLILRTKRISRPRVHLPIWMLKGPAALAERLFPRPPLTRDQLTMLQEDNVCSENAAAKELGLSFQGPEEILPTYLR
ncbi:complex I NDUFA9 subunit family protein [Candidatus Manganitrophus noduliformans]|uniref:Complex I NDUFA9 subunit family protein n=1 Tax=Candidatus Manganitrophus noduliformans TaxID=2606439 RepID=A0A7X6DM68_9BACT|nr:complex I NDUFA9 subunit family protein [Candidatus Manganitrophus noduliformans]NKE69792.1 complex I NDUFA9 subunit family protein [Candidatus Manganitrophus noduliformans]